MNSRSLSGEEELPVFLPVEIIERRESVITVNGYDIKITGKTDTEALRTVLKAIGHFPEELSVCGYSQRSRSQYGMVLASDIRDHEQFES